MQRFNWSRLNNQQVGAYAEYFVKMELTMRGFEVYTPEVDDRGIDFVARRGGAFMEFQVKSLRGPGYVFATKANFKPRHGLHLAFVMLVEGQPPRVFLLPSERWLTPDGLFADRPYGEGLKSKPEWGLNVSTKNMPLLEPFAFDAMIDRIALPNADDVVVMQQRLHDHIRIIAGPLIAKQNQALPVVTRDMTADSRAYFPVMGMMGGFSFWLTDEEGEPKLICEHWSRQDYGGAQRYEITAAGARLIADGFDLPRLQDLG